MTDNRNLKVASHRLGVARLALKNIIASEREDWCYDDHISGDIIRLNGESKSEYICRIKNLAKQALDDMEGIK